MKKAINFQTIIMNLQQYWANQDCLIWQPYYTQVGAGTYNPATYLRVLGPEPWHVAYVEPSVRPDDGRYGENPNRLQQHTQFQVILKPDPGNPQEIYLKSLEALGIDPREHDIRFVEDNWESPALGAWGLGWEVWLDGQEITQFTYFQQAGGIVLEPVSVEITYGLERIAMTLQNVRNFRDITWSPERTYGDVHLQGEQEHSKYYFEVADVERARKMYDLFEAEALSALEQGLVLPAHDYVLKCSHTFNILDTRGAVGVTERAALFARMRDMSAKVARAYLDQRTRLEFPWLPADAAAQGEAKAAPAKTVFSPAELAALPAAPADFLFEVGTEELPAADLTGALAQLKERVPALLTELRLSYTQVDVFGTPRRLVVMVKDLSGAQPDRESLVKGPPASRAFDADGNLTKAGEGFARSRGLSAADLQTAEIDGGQYVVAKVFEKGLPAVAVLAEALPALIAGLKFDKSMRWNSSGVAFSRPIRWLLALFGDKVVPFEYAGLLSGDQTRGLRFREPESQVVTGFADYLAFLKSQGILLEPAVRAASILEQTQKIITAAGGDPQKFDPALLEEVTNLVEAPTALRGSFDPAHLRLPADVLVSVMKKHQRYFPIYSAEGSLLPYFVVVRNGDDHALDVVADGNEQVVRARFADADFFIKEDLQQSLADFLPRLGTLTFQVKLGSMLDKTHRIEKLVEALLPMVKLDAPDAAIARRTAQLCKADLVTHMVIEMTSLAGIMGRFYAEKSGEPAGVPQAIFESNLPRYTGDAAPKSPAGLVVGMADRLDTLAGLFSAGLMPSGTKDPFAQRRAALGLVQNLITWELEFDLRAGLQAAAANLPIPAPAENIQACLEFIAGRLQSHLMDQGYRYDIVQGVLAEQAHNPASAARAIQQLSEWVTRPEWPQVLAAYARCVRITRDQTQQFTIDPAAFEDDMEKALLSALLVAETSPREAGSVNGFLNALVAMVPVINQFFEKVLVMSDKPAVKANRLGLLQRVAALSAGVADFSRLEGF
jgi:glycyl-tRNA synthetase